MATTGFVSIVPTTGHVHLPLLGRIKSSKRKNEGKDKDGESEGNSGRKKALGLGTLEEGRGRPTPNLIWFTLFPRGNSKFPNSFYFP